MEKIELRNVKGCRDYSSNEQMIRNYVESNLRIVFERYGFKPLQTSILCYYDLLALKYSEDNDILKEVYRVSDQGGRNLALRYDLTVPFAKYIAMNKGMKLPYKRYEIGEVFRNGPVKLGRDREFIQCDVDCVGIEGQEIEAELVALYVEGFNKLGIDVTIKYNNRKFLSGIIIEAGISEKIITDTITVIDKFEKLSKEELENEFIKVGLSKDQIKNLIKYLNMSVEDVKQIENCNQSLKEGIEELQRLKKYLKELDLLQYTQFSPSLARGQEYYTGTVFEVYSKDEYIKSSIGGGGRYDNMITEFVDDGKKYPAVGISFGLNVIYEILKNRKQLTNKSLLDVYVVPINTKLECIKIAQELRKEGYNVEVEMTDRKLKKSLEYANEEKIPYVIILGEDEVKENIVTVKNMVQRKECKVELERIKEFYNLF